MIDKNLILKFIAYSREELSVHKSILDVHLTLITIQQFINRGDFDFKIKMIYKEKLVSYLKDEIEFHIEDNRRDIAAYLDTLIISLDKFEAIGEKNAN